ncbi:MAG: hypothetical protein AABN95_27440, partial [Acidobacteriota bacterium]
VLKYVNAVEGKQDLVDLKHAGALFDPNLEAVTHFCWTGAPTAKTAIRAKAADSLAAACLKSRLKS